MLKSIFYLTSAILLFSNLLVNAQNLLRSPESVIFDEANNRYLAANYNGGDIIQIDMDGNQSIYNADLISSLGMHIVGDK